MKNTVMFLLVIIMYSHAAVGQDRVVNGMVINEDLFPIPGVNIWTKDSVLLGKTDREGRFSLVASQKHLTILFSGIGLEWANTELSNNCELIEIVMLDAWHLDFMSLAKMNRHRLREFGKATELYAEAFRRGIFLKENFCYSRSFEPYKRIRK